VRHGAAALDLGFRGFAAAFQPSVEEFLARNGSHLTGLTRIVEPDRLVSCVRDMRPDYLLVDHVAAASGLTARLSDAVRGALLASLSPSGDGLDQRDDRDGIVIEPIAMEATATDLALALRALMRRTRPQALVGRSLWGDLVLDEACLTFAIRGRPAALSREVFGVLGVMMDAPDRVWDRRDLHRLIFGAASGNDLRAIDTRISRARRHVSGALGCDPIRSVRGVGYALVAEP
jgi:two-component system phosphate regulon response regulator PhoB